ncbi:pilus assembly protein [Endozoicomonas atrinae]|uniref:pilus assembly protein n=1 Tax=Endozoicomonas atrinae TaxID=1333660 RepID=UPI000B12045B|nr:PilC/PilY family type IV pilus protein [Endozoicomonas atrinae]
MMPKHSWRQLKDLENAIGITLDSFSLPLGRYVQQGGDYSTDTSVKVWQDNVESSIFGGLDFGGFQMNFTWGQENALRFRDLKIPANATITKASVEFIAVTSDSGDSRIEVSAERAKMPSDFKGSGITENRTPALSWYPGNWSKDRAYSVDVTSVVEDLLNDQSLNWNDSEYLTDIVLIFERKSGSRSAYKIKQDGSQKDKAAHLTIEYSVNSSINQSFFTGLRFQDVGVPQGATIKSASIDFTASATDDSQLQVEIFAGNPGSTANQPFSNSNGNLTTRPKWDSGSVVRTLDPWVKGTLDNHTVYPVDITSLMQRLVNHNNWCGNDVATFYFSPLSNGLKHAYSIDGNRGLKPRLKVEYSGGENGCRNELLNTRIQSSDNDAYQSGKTVEDRENTLLMQKTSRTKTITGLHYPSIPIKQGAKILSATIELTAREDSSNFSRIIVQADAAANSNAITPSNNNLSNRNKTVASIRWENDQWERNEVYSSDITAIIQELVDKSGWVAGNNITLLLTGDSGTRKAISYDDNPSLSPRLKIKVASGGIDQESGYKVRDHLISLVNSMYPDGGTPLTPTYYEGAKYFRDGKGSHPSPINNVCQSNYTVLLTDGEANSSDSDDWNNINNLTKGISSSHCKYDSNRDGERCARTLSTWLNTTDLSTGSNMDGTQNVFTHTIAFGLKDNQTVQRFLKDIATNGGGEFYTADNAAELAKAFNNIITGIIEDESSFVSPGVTANQFNNSRHLSQVYYSVFKPSKTDRWQGNLKRYQLTGDPLDVYDARPALAVDSKTGFFKEEAFSYWSKQVDGRKVNIGGAGDNIPASSSRKLFTYTGANPKGNAVNLNSNAHRLHKDNANISATDLGLTSSNNSRRTVLLDWIRDPNTWYGDPLHSVPALVTYGCSVQEKYCPEANQTLGIFFGTNDGFIHSIDADTGGEKFAFMPQELLKNLDRLESNAVTNRTPGHGRPYGMDGSVTLWVNDVNKNGVIWGGYDTLNYDQNSDFLSSKSINKGEFVYAYIGMRRGGRSYYALDVTTPDSPELLWFISGGDSGFERLGQTWAKPVKTKIKIGSTIRDVLVFSGGYDKDQDETKLYQTDNMGNAIYIVDAKTGERIWSAGNDTDTSANLKLSKMNYSIPGGVRVIDLEGDGLADQLLFADVGGQVWRLFINNCTSTNTSECAVPNTTSIKNLVWPTDSDGDGTWDRHEGIFAYIGPDLQNPDHMDGGKEQRTQSRRFFVEPDASLFRLNGATHLALAIGTGSRPDPLSRVNEDVQDRAYVLASPAYANPVVNKDNVGKKEVPVHKLLKHDSQDTQLFNITNEMQATAEDAFGNTLSSARKGWFLDLDYQEKVMTESVTFEEVIYFNTYLPSDEVSASCNPVAGKARAYSVDLLTGKPADSDLTNPEDRYKELANSGLPPTTSILFPEGSKDALVCVGAECDPLEIGDDKQTTYWRQVQ